MLNCRDARAANAFWIALALMVLSGFAALGYQVVWTQQSALWLGHETAAVLAVVAALFGGTFLLLLPATVAVGATLPAMERVLAGLHQRGASIAALYAGSTFGAVLAATSLPGIGFEVLVVRVLSQLAENTVYTFAMLLAVYLVGTALGAAAYHRRFAGDTAPASAAASASTRWARPPRPSPSRTSRRAAD